MKRTFLTNEELKLVPEWNKQINRKYFSLKEIFKRNFENLESEASNKFSMTDAICTLFEYEEHHHIMYGNCSSKAKANLEEFLQEFSYKLHDVKKPSGCIYLFALYVIWKRVRSDVNPSVFNHHISEENQKKHALERFEKRERGRIEKLFRQEHVPYENIAEYFSKYFDPSGNHKLLPEVFADACKHEHELGSGENI